jgi:hypothetical protein
MRISKLAVMAVVAAPVAAFMVPNRYQATSRSSPRLEVANEITDITALDLPLLIAPVAAFLAGSLALKQKERLESEVALTEEKLEQIQQQIKSSNIQINVSLVQSVYQSNSRMDYSYILLSFSFCKRPRLDFPSLLLPWLSTMCLVDCQLLNPRYHLPRLQ